MEAEIPDIEGAADVVAWFGYWPNFHDAEVDSITLSRTGESRVVIHAFKTPVEEYAAVTFHLNGFTGDQFGTTSTRIDYFNEQNVLSGAFVRKLDAGFELVLEGIYGVDGALTCQDLRVSIKPTVQPARIMPDNESASL